MAGRKDIEAGAAFVRLYVKNNELIKGLASAGDTVQLWGRSIATIGAGIAGLGGAILTPLFAATEQFAASGDEINKMAQRTGASTEALSELRYAAGQSGATLQDLEIGFKTMAKQLDAARDGSDGAAEVFSRLGILLSDLPTEPEKQMEILADALARISDPSERAALALKIFGKSGTNLLPLMSDGAKGIRELREEAAELGLTIDQEQADNATNLGDAWDRVKSGLAGATFAIGGALAPALTDLLGIVKEAVVRIGNWVRENKELFVTAAKIGIVLVGIGGAVTAFGGIVLAAGIALSGLATVMTTVGTVIGTVMTFLVSGPGLLIGAIVGAVAYFAIFTETGRTALASIGDWFWALFDTAKQAWGGIVNAIMAGDLELAGRVAMAGLNVLWLDMSAGFKSAWIEAKFWFVSMWETAVAELGSLFISGMAGIESAWVNTTSFVLSAWDTVWTTMANSWHELQQGIGNLLIAAAEKTGIVGKEFATAWRESLNQPIDAAQGDRTRAAAQRQQEIEANRQKRLAEIGAGETGAQAILDEQRDAAMRAARAEADAARGSGMAEQEAARAELNRLTAEAETKSADRSAMERKKAEDEAAATGAGTIAAAASTGTFSAAAALAFGGGGGPQERLARTAEEQRKLAEIANELNMQMLLATQMMATGLRHA